MFAQNVSYISVDRKIMSNARFVCIVSSPISGRYSVTCNTPFGRFSATAERETKAIADIIRQINEAQEKNGLVFSYLLEIRRL